MAGPVGKLRQRGALPFHASFQQNLSPPGVGLVQRRSYHLAVSPKRDSHRCFCCRSVHPALAMCWVSRLQNAVKQNPDMPAKSEVSPEVHGVLRTLTRASGSISPPRAAPVASNPFSCEIVCDRPDPEAPAFSSQEVSQCSRLGGHSHPRGRCS